MEEQARMPLLNKPKVWLIGAAAILLAILISVAFWASNSQKPGEYFDRGSGETVYDPEGRTPEKFGQDENQPLILGISKLLDYGLTKYQLEALATAFTNYSESKQQLGEVSIQVATIAAQPRDPNSEKDTLKFDAVFDRKDTYLVTLDYFDLTAVRLIISAADGKEIYNSGVIDAEAGPSAH